MAASPSGVATLLALLASGPLAWAAVLLARRARRRGARRGGRGAEEPERGADGDRDGARERMPGVDYLLTLLGYAIGIGNLWRFPYMVGKWGGCAFVCAYLLCLVFVAIPLYLLELVLGQHTRKNTLDCFAMIHPRWAGLAYGQALMLFVGLGYYNVLLAYSCVYIAGSLLQPLPWSAEVQGQLPPSGGAGALNAPEAFWKRDVLNRFPQGAEPQGLGAVQWKLATALLAVWAIVFLSLAFGKRALAKVTWVTVLGPVLLLAVLLVQTTQLEGAGDGVAFYLGKFDAGLLLDMEMWAAACGQILFSLSPGLGTAVTLSSYSEPRQDVFRTCMIVALSNSAFSLVGGLAIFGVLGNLAFRTGRSVAQVASSSGTGLAFVAIAEGIQSFGPGANAMAVLFFVMLLSLGLDSTFAWAETVVAYVEDFRAARGWRPRRTEVVAATSAVFFLCGLPYCTRMGAELLDVLDHYCMSYYLLLGCCLEAVMFNACFGWERLELAVRAATLGSRANPEGRRVSPFWRLCLLTTAPLATGLLFVRLLVADLSRAYMGYPAFLQAAGWTALALCLAATPLRCRAGGQSTLPPLGGAAAPGKGAGPQAAEPARALEEQGAVEATAAPHHSPDGGGPAAAEPVKGCLPCSWLLRG